MSAQEIFELPITVEAHHLDDLNHVNNVVYLQWVQDVAAAHWNHKATEQMKSGYIWVVLNHYLEYKRPALLGEKLTARTYVQNYDGPKSERHVEILRGDTLLVQAKTTWCLLDKASQRPKRVPQEFGDLFIPAGQ
ncbi:MAG: thioesterase family protein [Cytophagales bacterium]|nr:thioesterase family protein [Cytophagales bacterium]